MKPIMQKKALENAELCKELVQHMVVVVVQKRTCGGGVVLVGEEVAVGRPLFGDGGQPKMSLSCYQTINLHR